MTRHHKDLGIAFDSLRSKGEGGGGKKEKKEGGRKKRRGDWGKKEGNACYSNPVLFTSADTGARKFLLR